MIKDAWDKGDVVGKFVIPVVVAITALVWNGKANDRATATQMVGIATAILSQPPENETPDALRDWAVDVLGSPANPPTLSREAMEQLKEQGIPAWAWDLEKAIDAVQNLKDPPSRFPKSPLEPSPLDLP